MKQLKSTVISLSMTVLMFCCMAGLLFLGSIVKDRLGDGSDYQLHQKNWLLSQPDCENMIAGQIEEYILSSEFYKIAQYAEQYDILYDITLQNGRPVMSNFQSSSTQKQDDVFTFFVDNEQYKVVILLKTAEKGSYHFLSSLWRALYRHIPLLIIACLFFGGLLVISFYLFLHTAVPVYKAVLAILTVLTVETAGILSFDLEHSSQLILADCVEKAILLVVTVYYLLQIKKLHRKAQKISDPNTFHMDAQSNSKYFRDCKKNASFPISLQPFAMDLDAAYDNVSLAVSEKMKSERLKTELISNVSHDIKTPLTSIINFADLIFHEEKDFSKTRDYAKRLHAQSLRLKELMEALIEASKASVGAIEINPVPCNVQTLIEQCIVEYEEKLKQNGIELIVVSPFTALSINADVKALSRIFDNLLTNICKYAMPGSRAYLEAKADGDYAIISFKNISKDSINITSEELLERFVRGDVSRHSEGHGLGLSIVKSLMDLMNAGLTVSAKYDIFEVKLRFLQVKSIPDNPPQ